MKIVDVDVIAFRVPRQAFRNGELLPEQTVVQTLTKIVTDEGAEGYYLGGRGHGDQDGLPAGDRAALRTRLRSMLVGQDPFDREKFWHWMWVSKTPENILSTIDMALWDLQARAFGVPIHKLLGGCRTKVKAYASTFPNMGSPQEYAAHALECKRQGYTAYKIHPYYFWDPETQQPDPGRPSHTDWDIECCRAVRAAVGRKIALRFDANQGYHVAESMRFIEQTRSAKLELVEQPTPRDALGELGIVTRRASLPIMADESLMGLRDAFRLARGGGL